MQLQIRPMLISMMLCVLVFWVSFGMMMGEKGRGGERGEGMGGKETSR